MGFKIIKNPHDLERYRYQPRFNEKISKLPLYTSQEVRHLKELAEDQKWNIRSSAGNFANSQEPPLYSSNTFYEYLDECLIPDIVDFLMKNLDNMPLHINSEESWKRSIALWRLKIGK